MSVRIFMKKNVWFKFASSLKPTLVSSHRLCHFTVYSPYFTLIHCFLTFGLYILHCIDFSLDHLLHIFCVYSKSPTLTMWPPRNLKKIFSISMLFVTFSCFFKFIVSILPIIRWEEAFRKSFWFSKLPEALDKYLMSVMLIHYNIQNENKAIPSTTQCKSPLPRFIATEIAFTWCLTFCWCFKDLNDFLSFNFNPRLYK